MIEQNRELIVKAGFPDFEQMYVVTERAELERFAELVRADEREACAQLCVNIGATKGNCDQHFDMADECAEQIRARGEVK
jgi:hypothetical protein